MDLRASVIFFVKSEICILFCKYFMFLLVICGACLPYDMNNDITTDDFCEAVMPSYKLLISFAEHSKRMLYDLLGVAEGCSY